MKKLALVVIASVPCLLSGCELTTIVGHAYFVSPSNDSVYDYSIGSDNSIKLISSLALPAAGTRFALTTDLTGQYVIVANNTTGEIDSYTVGSKGNLSSSPTAITTSPSNTYPYALAIDPSAQYAYVANTGSTNTITEYAIGTNGALTLNTTLNLSSTIPNAIAADPLGTYIYLLTGNSEVSTYTIGEEGTLTLATTSSVSASGAYGIAIDPAGQYAYVATTSGVSEYTIGADGGLTLVETPVALTGTAPYSIAVDPTDSFVYVTSQDSSSVSVYSIGKNGVLTSDTAVTGPASDVSALAMTNHL